MVPSRWLSWDEAGDRQSRRVAHSPGPASGGAEAEALGNGGKGRGAARLLERAGWREPGSGAAGCAHKTSDLFGKAGSHADVCVEPDLDLELRTVRCFGAVLLQHPPSITRRMETRHFLIRAGKLLGDSPQGVAIAGCGQGWGGKRRRRKSASLKPWSRPWRTITSFNEGTA